MSQSNQNSENALYCYTVTDLRQVNSMIIKQTLTTIYYFNQICYDFNLFDLTSY